jgi:4'-phosphopantetheinyl transferase
MLAARIATSWQHPPKTWILESDTVHVWSANLDVGTQCLQALQGTLSIDEQDRATRFHFCKDRRRFIAARGVLRAVLGRYLKRDPSELRFRHNACGKPALHRESAEGLCFNISHSAGLALYAVARDREVGIDVEYLRPSLARERIAERVFSPTEVTALRRLPGELQPEAFFTLWTLKEAFIKAKGDGFALPMNSFEVTLPSEGPVCRLMIYGQAKEAQRWSLLRLSPAAEYLAALAAEGSSWQFQCYQWREQPDKHPDLKAALSPQTFPADQ